MYKYLFIFCLLSCELATYDVNNDPKKEYSPKHIPTLDDVLVKMNERIEGFGGYSFEENGMVRLLIKEDTFESFSKANEVNLLEELFDIHPEIIQHDKFKMGANVNYVSVNYEFKELAAWREIIRRFAVEIPGISFLDIDETMNEIVISTEQVEASTPFILDNLQKNNIPIKQ